MRMEPPSYPPRGEELHPDGIIPPWGDKRGAVSAHSQTHAKPREKNGMSMCVVFAGIKTWVFGVCYARENKDNVWVGIAHRKIMRNFAAEILSS